MRILVAEDNEFYRCMLAETLAEWGYEVLCADDGHAAWRTLQGKDAPPLAILDWVMPGPDGIELCRRVRALGRENPTYLILLTATSGKENIVTALEAGADDYLCKPFDREELHARLQVGLRIVRLQASLAARVHELEQALSGAQKMEAVGRLAGGVAHDFNNLLTIILSSSDIVLGTDELGAEEREMVRLIKDAGERGARLTRQLLTFSRRQVVNPQILSLNGRVTEAEGMLRRLIGEEISFVTRLDPALPPVKADPGQIDQVLMNLVVNARDAMPEGGTLRIETGGVDLDEADAAKWPALRPGRYAVLSVGDTGCGMDEETKKHIFEPFFTTKEVGKGTGLGLATVYGIVKHSDGHIAVDSEPGRGTIFRIYLPEVEEVAGVVVSRPSAQGTSALSGKETVLLAEDDDGVRALARAILQAHHYHVLEARDGDEAVRLSSRWPKPIDLLVTDVSMPRLSGLQLVDRLKPSRPAMKVLYVSAYPGETIGHGRLLHRDVWFLQKPFTPSVLVRKVREILDHSTADA